MGLSKKPLPGSLPLLQVIELQPQGGRMTQGNRKIRYEGDTNDEIGAVKGFLGLSPKVKGLILLNLVCVWPTYFHVPELDTGPKREGIHMSAFRCR